MDLFWVFYAASCFLFFAWGRYNGFIVGVKAGKKYMKALVQHDISRYPNKWRHYINRIEQ